jgi:Bacteriophage clamp loader A subunit
MPDLFKEILPSILQNKKSVINSDEEAKDYTPFLVNKALSHHIDCIMYSNNMNMNFHLHKKAQYDYLINTIRAMKRPHTSWFKASKSNDLEAVKLFFGYSTRQAREAIKLLTDEQIEIIKTKTFIGE